MKKRISFVFLMGLLIAPAANAVMSDGEGMGHGSAQEYVGTFNCSANPAAGTERDDKQIIVDRTKTSTAHSGK